MIQNRKVGNLLVSFDHMCQFPCLHVQLENQWHLGAENQNMKGLKQGFYCLQEDPNQDLSIVDF